MKEVVKKPWNYTLFCEQNEYFLSVICGGVAVFEINIKLDENEKKKYFLNGLEYLDELVRRVQYDPAAFATRNIGEIT